ncbi:MAG: hypothetical protein JRF33_25220, partial [Deltaproteobacteria bacterium]|nr:hypothetical protein [Deltaproteobacteria bacterium]
AEEWRQRLEAEGESNVLVGTGHALALEFVRKHLEELELAPVIEIADDDQL